MLQQLKTADKIAENFLIPETKNKICVLENRKNNKFMTFITTPFPHHRCSVASLLLLYNCFNGKVSERLYSLVPGVQTFKTRTFHATFMKSNHLHFLYCHKKLPLVQLFFPKLLLCETDSYLYVFLNTSILTGTSQDSVVIFPTYSYNLHFLFFHSYHTPHLVLLFC